MRINTSFLQLGFLLTIVKAHDPFSYNQIYNVHLDAPDESIDKNDMEFSVSSLALMGEKDMFGNFNIFLQQKEEHDNGNENDDDDQDDDDGSCSMLSNKSIFRNQEPIVTTTTYVCKEESKHRRMSSHRVASSPTSAALRMRGGAAPSASADVLRKLFVVALVTLVYEGLIGT